MKGAIIWIVTFTKDLVVYSWQTFKTSNMSKVISISNAMRKGQLDDDYTLYESGEIIHEYDKSPYPGQYNLRETLSVSQISNEVKDRLFNSASDENREIVRKILGL
jgi:hypothetical protein